MFNDVQIEALKAPLNRDNVKEREQGRGKVSYIEGWHAIAEANRIFGFGGWDRETVEVKCVMEKARKVGKGQYEKEGWGVTYIARVRITVDAGGENVVREGVGSGHGIDSDLGQAHESAIKEAETDAMKRALMTFGNQFGLALYDKEQREVQDVQPEEPKEQAPSQAYLDKVKRKAEITEWSKGPMNDLVAMPADEKHAWLMKDENYNNLIWAKTNWPKLYERFVELGVEVEDAPLAA